MRGIRRSLLGAVLAGVAAAALAAPPTVDEVLRMLQAGMAEQVVSEWLDSAGELAEPATADQMIALSAAGASDELLRQVVAASPSPGPARPGVDPGPSAPTAPTVPAGPAGGDPQAGIVVTFRLAYQPHFEDGHDPWDLMVYLDGKPLSFVPPVAYAWSRGEELTFERRLAPGEHTLWVFQELHRGRRGGAWRHDTRVPPRGFEFELRAGAPAEVQVSFRQDTAAMFTGDGPLSFKVVQDGRVTLDEDVGGDPDRWASLCEDARAGRRKGSEVHVDGCVRWADLWKMPGVPTREEVRDALAIFDFRPVPKDS